MFQQFSPTNCRQQRPVITAVTGLQFRRLNAAKIGHKRFLYNFLTIQNGPEPAGDPLPHKGQQPRCISVVQFQIREFRRVQRRIRACRTVAG